MTNYNNPQGNRVPDPNLPLTPAEQIERDRLDRDAARDGQVQFEREIAAENSGAASGIAIGGTIAALIALGAGAIYYFGRPQPAPTTIINTPASPAASTAPKPEQPTKTIERTTIDRTAPAPTPQVIEVPKPILVPGATKTIEVPKPILVPGATKTIEVPKPILVPGATKTIEVPRPTVTASPSTPNPSTQPNTSPDPASSSNTPATGASPSPDSSGSVSPATPSSGNN